MTVLSARAAVQQMKEYHPPLSGRDGLRLDFNENTDAPSPRAAAVLQRLASDQLTKYPERGPVEAAVAQHLRVNREQVLLTNGVDEAIHLVCETYLEPEDQVIVVVPTFSMYEIYAQSTGAEVIAIQANPDRGFRFPTRDVLAAITPRTRLIAIANPNNPTGATVARSDLLLLAESAPQAAVLVDEAYFDFWGETVLDAISKFPNLFVARTFSKAHGLAGLRVGVLVGDAAQIRAVRKVSSPYNVNAIALACIPEALADRAFITDYVDQVKQGRARLMIQLTCHGIPYWMSQANFVLANIGPMHREFVEDMRQRGILVRDRNADPGCAGCVRITVGTRAQMDQLLSALPETLNAIHWSSSVSEAKQSSAAMRRSQ
jgi:histidinol-phosphate aminotransferase